MTDAVEERKRFHDNDSILRDDTILSFGIGIGRADNSEMVNSMYDERCKQWCDRLHRAIEDECHGKRNNMGADLKTSMTDMMEADKKLEEMIDGMSVNKLQQSNLQSTLRSLIQEVTEDICDNYCKYRNTADEDNLCDATRDGKPCPLDKLQ